ncbi:MAG: YeeE/YedE thiosulfate transporter family protein [Dehalococcoidia bacterium]|nr:YeeE/YedE thiosulfate transporter family protein [Dehalococcoidia bacterium]
MTTAALATLLAGIALGYLGQRSRMCFVGAIRDFLLARDTYLLKGLAAFGLTAWVAFPVLNLLGGEGSGVSFLASPYAFAAVLLAAAGGLGLGVFSTLANGCPFRQHVMAAQGAVSAIAYLLGFYSGAVAFYWLLAPFIGQFL